MADRTCRICDGMGMRVVERADGFPLAEPCECRVRRRSAELLRRSQIPPRYRDCLLENYQSSFPGADPSLAEAFLQASGFVKNYFMHKSDGVGLLFTGSVGTGKTHLAVGILQALVLNQGVRALFCDQTELLKEVGNSYNKNVSTTELEVLRPILSADLLVIDELGKFNKSDWVSDIVAYVLNTRYNDKLTTIITTNYPNRSPARVVSDTEPELRDEPRSLLSNQSRTSSDWQSIDSILDRRDSIEGRKQAPSSEMPASGVRSPARLSFTTTKALAPKTNPERGGKLPRPREETLGERIGERMRSRLAEMCVTIELTGADYRQGTKRARF